MQATATRARPRARATPERWRSAVERADSEQIRVFQIASTGQWVASSGSRPGMGYLIEVTGEIAHGCECHAGRNGDPVCKHRAAFYLHIGTLEFRPQCMWCNGSGKVPNEYTEQFEECEPCGGTGVRRTQTQSN